LKKARTFSSLVILMRVKEHINVCVLHCSDLEGEVEQHITIMPNPAARRGSIANYAFPELHPKVNRKYKYASFSYSFQTKHLHFMYPMPWQAIYGISIQNSACPMERLIHILSFWWPLCTYVEECFLKGT
jgi:hypothetical protein